MSFFSAATWTCLDILIVAGREGLTRYGLDGDPEHLRYAIEMANLARILSSRLSDQEDWSTSSYLLARCISYLGREVSEQQRLQLGESAMQAVGDAVAAAVLASPAHLEAMELCAGFFAVGGESSRMVAHIVRQQGVLGTVLKSQPGIRLRMAAAWAEEEAERGNFELAARLYDAALAALDDLTSSHPFEGHREWWLGYTSSVRSKAAHACIRALDGERVSPWQKRRGAHAKHRTWEWTWDAATG